MIDRRESALLDELFDTQYEIIEIVEILVRAEWDSVTLKNKITTLLKQKDVIDQELYKLDESVTSDD